MKQFRKNKKGLFICEECGGVCIKKEGLSKHISNNHSTKKEYYDKWLKEDGEGMCKICNKETINLPIPICPSLKYISVSLKLLYLKVLIIL